MAKSLSKDLRDLRKRLEERGFRWEDRSGSGHPKILIQCPNGREFLWVLSGTPSDQRNWINQTTLLRRELRGAGYPDERKFLRVTENGTRPGGVLNCLYDMLDSLDSRQAST